MIFKKSDENMIYNNASGEWRGAYTRETMKDAKQEALQKIEELENGEN